MTIKKIILLFYLASPLLLFSQNTYCIYQDVAGVTFGELDNISGTYTPRTNTICNSSYWSTIDPIHGHFIFKGQEFANQSVSKLYTVDINNGNILNSIDVTDGNEGIRNMEYNSCDSTLYVLYKNTNGITFGKLDNISGTYTPLTNTICFSSYWSTIDSVNGRFIFKGQEFANQSVSKLYTLDINNGNILSSINVTGGIIAIRNMESLGNCYNNECQEVIEMPNVFTPNNDGINDFFRLDNVSCFSQTQLTIYNRWGTKMFETNNLQVGWDGLNTNDGVYFWTLSYVNSKKEQLLRQGYLTLLK
jgi:gliding motility-associated-like protein